jgi:glycosyltransferase involved in cell wall biosynthesis
VVAVVPRQFQDTSPGPIASEGERSVGPLRKPGVLIIVQNLPVPFDRRVWLECQALRSAGYDVSVVCPKAPGDPSEETVEGVDLYKYRPHAGGSGPVSFFVEYAYSFAATLWLTLKAFRQRPFDVLQACNPPDIFWPIALGFRLFTNVRFVFDHHDLCPELFESRFGGGPSPLGRALRVLEWCTFRTAHHVISTNDSYRQVAIERGGKPADAVTVVRTGPDADRLHRSNRDDAWRGGRKHLVAYLGVMGPQDGVDLAVRCAEHIVHRLGRDDVSFVFVGSGDCFEALVALCGELELTDQVLFTGRVSDDVLSSILSTADVGLCPDPKNPLNDVSTMNKTMEYMAYSVPVVAFDLRETRVSAGDSALYATPNDVGELATKVLELLDDEERRRAMGEHGRQRIVDHLAWFHQKTDYVGVYERITGRVSASTLASASKSEA